MDGDYQGFWHDSEIRFDVGSKDLAACPGEFEIEKLDDIEDSKGNSGERGQVRSCFIYQPLLSFIHYSL
jgi:hypothetical protein